MCSSISLMSIRSARWSSREYFKFILIFLSLEDLKNWNSQSFTRSVTLQEIESLLVILGSCASSWSCLKSSHLNSGKSLLLQESMLYIQSRMSTLRRSCELLSQESWEFSDSEENKLLLQAITLRNKKCTLKACILNVHLPSSPTEAYQAIVSVNL